MKQIALLALGLLATLGVEAQTYKFDFTTGKKTKRRLYQNNSRRQILGGKGIRI